MILGFKRQSKIKGQLNGKCPSCHSDCAQTMVEISRVFTFLSIPLIPFTGKSALVCTSCGYSYAASLDAEPIELPKLKVSAEQVNSGDLFPLVVKNKRTRQSFIISAVAILSTGLLAMSFASSSFSASLFGASAPTKVEVPVYIKPNPIAEWTVGMCVAVTSSGSQVYPVLCTEPHAGVVTSAVASRYDCPYYSNYTHTYNASATFIERNSKVYCYVKSNVANG